MHFFNTNSIHIEIANPLTQFGATVGVCETLKSAKTSGNRGKMFTEIYHHFYG